MLCAVVAPAKTFSVAGKRAGLAGARSGLFMEQIRIIKEMREHDRELHSRQSDESVRPRYMVWENVYGAFSSGNPKGADFAAVLEETIKIAEPKIPNIDVPEKGWPTSGCYYDEMGRWSVAWRVHDAQFWGVPQRRVRIALVADFGGLSAPEILFERKGMSRNIEPSIEERKGASTDTQGGFNSAIGIDEQVRNGNNKLSICTFGHDERSSQMTTDGISDPLTASDFKQPTTLAYGFDQGAASDVGDLFLQEKSKTLSNGSCPCHHNGVCIDDDEECV